ncbi:MAG: amidohydrolase family protein [Phycisphaerales bacterium]|nr:amidohydrolase family protein [Phycisphaerales bacterium]
MEPAPRLRDAHLHLAEHGMELSAVHLDGCRSPADCLNLIAAGTQGKPQGQWIIATGARIQAWREPRYPTARELDEASGGRCVVVRSFDHHAMAVSSAVLAAAGISRGTPDPEGGIVERDARGVPTGVLLEAAGHAVHAATPRPTPAEYRGFVETAIADLRRLGFVEVHDMLSTAQFARTLLELEREGRLDMVVRLHPTPEHLDGVVGVYREGGLVRGDGRIASERTEVCGMKLFVDGTLNSRTAAMLHPFREAIAEHPRGTLLIDGAGLDRHLSRAVAAGLPLVCHAIGDRAVREVLDALERGRERWRGLNHPPRVEHAQFTDGADVPRFPGLGVVCSPQPCHLLTDVEAIRRFVPHREARAFALRDFVEAFRGAGLDPAAWIWLGSDTPVVRPNHEDNIQAAVHRRRPGDGPEGAVAPEQAIDAATCLALSRAAGPVSG